MDGIVTVVGHGAIPGSGAVGVGSFGSGSGVFGRAPTFAGSADIVTTTRQALERLQNAADEARALCIKADWFSFRSWGIDWFSGNNATDSICDRAEQLQLAHDDWMEKVNDARTTDTQLVDILHGINNAVDVSDLVALERSTNPISVTGEAILDAPGTVIDWVGSGASHVVEGIAGNLPWWVWVAGGTFLAVQTGLIDFRKKR